MENIDNKPEKSPANYANAYVVTGNMLILLFYTIYIKSSSSHSGQDVMFGLAFLIVGQIILNVFVGVVLLAFRKLEKYGKACLLSAVAVLLIGFSTCWLIS